METYERLNHESALGSGTKPRFWALCVALYISDRYVGEVAAEELCELRVCAGVPLLRDGSKAVVSNVYSILGSCDLTVYSRHRLPRADATAALVLKDRLIRARREARVLETALGDAYREYRSKMWF